MSKNRLCDVLGIEKPVIQGALAWLTDAKLVAAVGNAGGMGVLGPNAGQTTVTPDPGETAERMRDEIRKVRQLSDKPFAVNIGWMTSFPNTFAEPILKVVYEEHVPVALYSGEIDTDLIKDMKVHDMKVIYRELNPTVEGAQQAEAAGADAIVATGFDEGGTLPGRVIGTFSIVPMLVDAVSIPVLAAGAVSDARTAKAAFDLGAEGLYCGTVFIASQECRVPDNVKQAIINHDAVDLGMYKTWPSYYRSLPGALADELVKRDAEGATREELAKLQGGIRNMKVGMLDGDTDKGYISVGTGISLIHDIKPVSAIIDTLTADLD